MLQKGTILEARYLLAGQMASGGFADIYVASDMRLGNKPVIIKMLRSDFTEDTRRVRMFIDEINLTTFLDHENIVRVYDVIRTEEDTYLQILELIDGPDLNQIIRETNSRKEKIPYDLVAYILCKVCLALDYAHELNDPNSGNPLSIVHRDISPSNILISYEGKVKLTDFGIAFAHLHQRQKTQLGEIKGKISYMSPEQVRGQTVDRRSDIYSLGIVMYEALTRKRLFEADSDLATLQMVAAGKVDLLPLDEMNAPDSLKEILLKALQKKISERYETAYEMYRDLQEYIKTPDEYSLSTKLKDYLSGMKRETTRLTQLLRVLKGEGKRIAIQEVSLTPEKTVQVKAEGGEDEKTIYDLIRKKQGRSKKIGAWIGSTLLIAALAFAGVDTFYLKKTPLGEKIYNFIYPPNLWIESIPEGAEVYLDDKLLNNVTPFNLSKISPGNHIFEFHYEGYEPVKISQLISSVEEWKKLGRKDPQEVFGQFKFHLIIESKPQGANIYLDNATEPIRHSTPAIIPYHIQEKPLQVRLEQEGFEDLEMSLNFMDYSDRKEQVWEIKKERDEEDYFQYNLMGTFYSHITVTSLPESASVINLLGEVAENLTTPVTFPLGVGDHSLKVEKDNLIPRVLNISIESGKPETLHAILSQEVTFNVYDSDKKIEKNGVSVKIIKEGKQVSKGVTPLTDTLETGRYKARFGSIRGYQSIDPISFRVPTSKPVTAELSKSNPLLTVRVIDAKTESPVGDAEVTFKAGNEGSEQSGFTSANGVLSKRIRPGEISLWVSMPGYKKSSERTEKIEWGKDLTVIFRLEPFLKAPLLKNMTREKAEALLKRMGLGIEVNEVTDPSHPYGVIIRQSPAVGEIVEEGATIRITVNVKKEEPKEELEKKEPKKKEVKRRRSGE
ncbi:protein kinase [candidate division TA06 bacterium]|nr:protein kinase [candidate division TA06 bacterium]